MKSKIFIWCSHCSDNCHYMVASTEDDNETIARHVSSDHEYGKYDMGFSSSKKHEIYKEKYPDGYELHYVDNNKNPFFGYGIDHE